MTVETLVADARKYSKDVLDKAQTFLEDGADRVLSVGFTTPNFFPAVLPEAPPSTTNLTPPTLQPVDLELGPEPSELLTFQDIPALDPGQAPTFNVPAPTLVMPTTPSQIAEFTRTAPGLKTDYEFPEVPDALLNPVAGEPVIVDRAAPQKPDVALPSFDAVQPTGMPDAPTNLGGMVTGIYRDAFPVAVSQAEGYIDAMLTKYNPQFHVQMDRVESALTRLMSGGTGMTPAVENALYEREHSKNLAEARRVSKSALRAAADAGFTMPTGAALAAGRAARQAAADTNARANTEIVVMQAKLEQENLQFAITTSVGLRATLLSATQAYMQNLAAINGQALDFAKSVLSASIESYNIAQKAFAARLDAYKAEAVVYEVRLKASMAGIELYRAEIQALEAMTNVDRAKVDIYKARIDVLQAQGNIYKTRIEAVLGQASLEKLKLEQFQVEVQAYQAQVQGKDSEWKAYVAGIEGQTSQVKLYEAQANVFATQTQGYRAVIDAKAKVIDAAATTNQARAQQYAAMLSGYKTVAEVRGQKAQLQIEGQKQQLYAFQVQNEAAIGNARVQAIYYEHTARAAISNAEMRFRVQVEEGNSRRAFSESIARLSQLTGDTYGRLAGAAVSGMNTLVSDNTQR